MSPTHTHALALGHTVGEVTEVPPCVDHLIDKKVTNILSHMSPFKSTMLSVERGIEGLGQRTTCGPKELDSSCGSYCLDIRTSHAPVNGGTQLQKQTPHFPHMGLALVQVG